jgi:transposase
MATLQKRKSRGNTYWSIVESRRVNGKPRPVILAYLGRAEDLLKRLREGIPHKVKSYSHGSVAALLQIAEELRVVETINKHLPDHCRTIRAGFTVGGSLLLAAIGRACKPTSKDNWYQGFARDTSLSYLLKMSLSKLDSQHFWDQMDVVPSSAIALIEEDLVRAVMEIEMIKPGTLLCDMSNFFTYIASDNSRCSLAQRGKNKQKRIDLRQLGILLLVTREHHLPLLHKIYQGNLQDRTVFKEYFESMVNRFKAIYGSLEDITLVFDQGNNSKKMLSRVDAAVHFVGAVSPFHHKELVEEANRSMTTVTVSWKKMQAYHMRTVIWELDLTVVVYISETLLKGQIQGIEQNIVKLFSQMTELREKIKIPTQRGPKRTKDALGKTIEKLISSLGLKDLVVWQLDDLREDAFELDFWIDQEHLTTLKDKWLGRRILITNHHNWSTEEIVLAYWGQAQVEYAFKNLKNPFHLAVRPQYHWTDQKIEVHALICLIAFLLSMVLYKRVVEKTGFNKSPHNLLESLSAIRLATFIESPKKKTKGRYKATQRIEEIEEEMTDIARVLGLLDQKLKTNIPFSVYK